MLNDGCHGMSSASETELAARALTAELSRIARSLIIPLLIKLEPEKAPRPMFYRFIVGLRLTTFIKQIMLMISCGKQSAMCRMSLYHLHHRQNSFTFYV